MEHEETSRVREAEQVLPSDQNNVVRWDSRTAMREKIPRTLVAKPQRIDRFRLPRQADGQGSKAEAIHLDSKSEPVEVSDNDGWMDHQDED